MEREHATSPDSLPAESAAECSRMLSESSENTSQTETRQAQDNQETEMEMADDIFGLHSDATIQYLTGKITFEEYSAIIQDDADVDIDNFEISLEKEVETSEDAPVASTSDLQVEKLASPAKAKEGRRRRGKLPKHVQGLMGEANVKFARGEQQEAIAMCMEVIRQAPSAPEPFQTLAMIYEENGDTEKTLQYGLIAAHLNPRDSEEWMRLADMCLEQDRTQQAISCYTSAIKHDPSNVSVWEARCKLYEKIGEKKKALEGYQQLIQMLPEDSGEKYFQLARELTKTLHASGDLEKATTIMKTAFVQHPKFVTAEDVNVLIELYSARAVYDKSLEILIQHCGVCLHYPEGNIVTADAVKPMVELPKVPSMPSKCVAPDEIPVDLRTKLVICLIQLRYKQCIKDVERVLLAENADDVGDLFLDVAEAYMENGDYENAESILKTLVLTKNYNLAAVWLRLGECLNFRGNLLGAVSAYKKVVDFAPAHLGARVSLSALQQQLGRHEEALQALQQDEPTGTKERPTLDLRLVFPRCMLLYSQNKLAEFVDCSEQVLFSHFKDIFTKVHMQLILGHRTQKHRMQALRTVLGTKFEQKIQTAASVCNDRSITVDDLWDLYLKLCRTLVRLKRFQRLQDISVIALMSPQFMSDSIKASEADFVCLLACMLNQNGHFAYSFVREICVKNLYNNRAWNMFAQIITLSQDVRHNRFCLRLMSKHPNHLALGILNGNNAMVSGTYKHALGEYVAAFRQDPTNPMLSLLVGITFIHIASQKFNLNRHTLTVQACAFLNRYVELRGECQESYYNVGRAMHQLGLLPPAVYYYNKALSFPAVLQDQDGMFDLSREIAFNLYLVYKSSKSYEMATMILQKYIVV